MGVGDQLGGRPRKELDLELAKRLCQVQCTAQEMSSVLDISPDTLDLRLKDAGYEGFTEFYKSHSDEGKVSVRRAQFKLATEELNPTMLIWLGKQMLGQRDKMDLDHTGRFTVNLANDDANL